MKEKRIFAIIIKMQFVILILNIGTLSFIVNTISGLQVGKPNPEERNPFSHTEGAPSISMKSGNNTYAGELRSAAFSYGDVNINLESFGKNSSNITSIIPDQIINISQGEQIQLFIGGNPAPENQPSSLSATAYYMNGTQVKVLSILEDGKKDKFVIDLDNGQYLTLTIATWLPNPDNYRTSSGYISYIFKVNVY